MPFYRRVLWVCVRPDPNPLQLGICRFEYSPVPFPQLSSSIRYSRAKAVGGRGKRATLSSEGGERAALQGKKEEQLTLEWMLAKRSMVFGRVFPAQAVSGVLQQGETRTTNSRRDVVLLGR